MRMDCARLAYVAGISRFDGALVLAARKEEGLTRLVLARTLRVTQMTIYNWETGASFPSSEVLPRLAKALGRPVDYFFARAPDA